jgi:hypothetical protein
MAERKEYNERRDLVAKTVRYKADDLAYIARIAKKIGIPPGVLMRNAVTQFVRMCKRHRDQVPMPHVSVPRNAAEEKGLVPPDEGLEEDQQE